MLSQLRNKVKLLLILGFLLLIGHSSLALQGMTGIHDPSTIIKRNGVYHTWGTGDQIYHLTSTDMVHWQTAPTVFAAGTWPGWINNYVSDFKGFFWAPECIYRNGKYYMYYSCSTGQRPCAIGLATSTDLTTWTDQGMVVYSDNSTVYGSIDPAVFDDANGRFWMVFGSHLTGIWSIELDPATGKRLNNVAKNLAGSGQSEHEAAYMMQHGGYYYLFYNRGTCCAGINSTYYVQMGRSTSPDGPFVDKNGVDLLAGGGTDFLARDDNNNARFDSHYGPGHVGLLSENGVNFLSFHYYDGFHNGTPALGISNLSWDSNGWPAVTHDWLPSATYTITSPTSGKVWAYAGCNIDVTARQPLLQTTAVPGQDCQQWRLRSTGNGVYIIGSSSQGINVDVIDCNEAAGTALSIRAASPFTCQRFWVERAADGSYVLSYIYGNRVIGVPNASTTDGTVLQLLDYTGEANQRWTITPVSTVTAARSAHEAQIQLFPNPTRDGNFSVQLPAGTAATIMVTDMGGRVVYHRELSGRGSAEIITGLGAGAYVVQVKTAAGITTRKLLML
ncbi:family 43 glycosylhydrolase [Hymenobacter taeanensis]|uniref:Family 43 glycosylhydrolase n=1 Tax=Hymenobacter taeanensis TaxID=2735321 RepID=A0A6M6BK14_9BACT|nr:MULTISPECIES: family 43 glycosylhydrolase [Hymenobacter]QJX48208.1 family 43 glycosylhydrolase [Hymenobacter taeanensis]UOQ82315.1 family 43 glycosylhydrolase [Hymenobacter sp. 5414T-23]